MSNLFKRIPATVGATGNEQFDFCSKSFLLSRKTKSGNPVREAQALYARSLARVALQSTALILIIVFSMMTMVKPAQASGTVSATSTYYHVWGPGYILNGSCVGLSSVAAIQSCELAINSKQSSCGAATLVDDGRLYGSTNAFRITITTGAMTNDLTKGGTLLSNGLMLLCTPPYVRTSTLSFQVIAASTCPAHAQPQWAEIPCTCTNPYKPDQAGTSCVLSEQYTIALHGLGGKDMVPKETRNAYALVTKSDGTAKSGAQVSLAYTQQPEDDGRPYSEHVGSISPNGGATGMDGRLNFEFTAPAAGATHTITATCTDCTNQATGTIKVLGCPVPPLTSPPFDDACATVLENLSSTQAQKNAACGSLTPELVVGRACLKDKLSQLSPAIPLAVTSDIRSVAYQAHIRQVWDRMEDVVRWMRRNPTIQTACAARRAELAAEKGCDNAGGCTSCYAESASQRSHCLVARPANPSPSDAKHTQGKAFDVSQTRTIDPLQAILDARTPPQKIPQFLSAPTNCNLSWGGAFNDPVHFYVP